MTEVIMKASASPAGDDPLRYVMSDESVDRMGDVIEAKGWKLGHFKRNPIALFNHKSDFPIGFWSEVKVEGAKLVSGWTRFVQRLRPVFCALYRLVSAPPRLSRWVRAVSASKKPSLSSARWSVFRPTRTRSNSRNP
jgi:hypothetical protein